jgi:hypothetical protein
MLNIPQNPIRARSRKGPKVAFAQGKSFGMGFDLPLCEEISINLSSARKGFPMSSGNEPAEFSKNQVGSMKLVRLHLCSEVLVRDVGRCLACGACGKACKDRHGKERWHGLWRRVGPFAMVPVCQGAPPLCASKPVPSRHSNQLPENRLWTAASASVAGVAPGHAPLRPSPAGNFRPGIKKQSVRTRIPARSPLSVTAAPDTVGLGECGTAEPADRKGKKGCAGRCSGLIGSRLFRGPNLRKTGGLLD